MRPDSIRVDLFQQRHNKLRFEGNGTSFTVTFFHCHGVEPIGAADSKSHNRTAQGIDQRRVFTFRVQNDNVIVCGQCNGNDKQFCEEGLTGTGNTKQHHGLVQQIIHVAKNQIVRNSILPKVNTTRFLDLLHLKRHEYRKALRGQRAESIDLSCADGKGCVQPIHLLVPQHRHLTHMVCSYLQQCIGICIQFCLTVCKMNNGQHGQKHPLVTGGQVGHIFLGLPPLLLHVIGNDSREIIVGILPALPVGDVSLHT